MANGTIAFDTLSTSGQIDGTARSIDTDYLLNGSAKLWMNLDGSTFGIGDSFNMTSATDNGAGDYTGTIANDMANTEWALTAHSGQAVNRTESDVTVTAFEIHTMNEDGSTKGDTSRVMVAGHGELA